jgi:hypothetical protein
LQQGDISTRKKDKGENFMAITNVEQTQAAKPQMSTSERAVRTFVPVPAAAYDIGRALGEGKSFNEAIESAGGKLKETHELNREAFKKNIEENPVVSFALKGGIIGWLLRQ